jgi:chemotaxis protein MotA
MDLATIIGIGIGATVVVIVMIMDGGTPLELFAHPSAILLIFGGSIAATTITTSLQTVMSLPKVIASAFTALKLDAYESIDLLVSMAEKARKDGLLSLEEEAKKVEDEFMQRGLMMVVDGLDPVQIRSVMETNIEQVRAQRRVGYSFFNAAGGFSPTFGIIGTVMGLISVLKQLDDPNMLAKSIAGAFLATLWGLLSANLIFLPLGGKLKAKSDEETHIRYMQLEGLMAIQAGENPRIVRDKLSSYLPPRPAEKAARGADATAPAAANKAEA